MTPRSQRNITFFLIIVLATLIGYIVYSSRTPKDLQETLGNPFLQNTDPKSFTKIVLTQEEKTTTLFKDGNAWFVEQPTRFPADTRVIEDLLKKLSTMRVQSIASRSKDNLETFTLDAQNRITLDLFQDQTQKSLSIGKTGPGQTTYVTSDLVDSVYLMNEDIASSFLDDFRDTTILSLDSSELTRVRWIRNENVLTIEKKESLWSGLEPEKFEIDQEKFNSKLSSISYLRAQEIPDQNQAVQSPLLIVSFFVGDTEYFLKIFPVANDAQDIIVQNQAGYFYSISKEQFQEFDVTRETIELEKENTE